MKINLIKFLFFFVLFVQLNSEIIEKSTQELFPVSIIHINDFHARFEETNKFSVTCKPENGEKCIGGYARLITMIRKLQKDLKETNPIYLNAGDNFQGTLWYNILKWNVTSYFLNLLPADAITLGNHEFDSKIEGVVPFLESLKSPVVVVNINNTEEPTLNNLYKNSTIIDRYARKIGIIGVILQTTNEIASTGKLSFFNESETIKEEAEKLKEQGVDIIIVLSHCGLNVDKIIAKNAGPNIDVIVGGHSHTFMYSGTNPPGPDKPAGEYPEVVIQDNGRKVLIVQASAFTKYVGNLTVYFDEDGDVVRWEGAPIFLDTDITPDEHILHEMKPWKEEVDAVGKKIVGNNRVHLSKSECNSEECNIGSFIVDSYVHAYINDPVKDENDWTLATISIANVGGIRTSLSKGILNYGDLVAITPFYNTLDWFDLQGNHLLDTLEYSVAKSYSDDYFSGVNFLQLSGLKVIYNITKPIGERVIRVDVLCRKCEIPKYLPLDKNEMYRIIGSSFLISGGDGFTMIRDNMKNHTVGLVDIDALVNYVQRSPITQSVTNRITVLK